MQYSMPSHAEKIVFKPIMLTPERAEQLLSNNHPNNRGMKRGKIVQMVLDIHDGNWKMTPEPIIVSNKGVLLDGQNRCQAVSEAQITVPVWLCIGAPEDIMVAVDCGASRNIVDAVKILGKDIKGVNGVSAVVKRMIAGLNINSNRNTGMSIQCTLDEIDEHADALAFAWECLPKNIVGITQASVRAVISRAYYKRPAECTRERCREFGTVLTTGLCRATKQDSAAIHLREWLRENFSRGKRQKKSGAPLSPAMVYAKTETALDLFLRHEPVEKLRETRNELFPLPGEKGAEKENVKLAEQTA